MLNKTTTKLYSSRYKKSNEELHLTRYFFTKGVLSNEGRLVSNIGIDYSSFYRGKKPNLFKVPCHLFRISIYKRKTGLLQIPQKSSVFKTFYSQPLYLHQKWTKSQNSVRLIILTWHFYVFRKNPIYIYIINTFHQY